MKTADIDLCVILFLFLTIIATDPEDLAHIPPLQRSALLDIPDAVFHGPGRSIFSRTLNL
jgi:hypothetical protein